jgi:hypothetical protein
MKKFMTNLIATYSITHLGGLPLSQVVGEKQLSPPPNESIAEAAKKATARILAHTCYLGSGFLNEN